MLSILLMLLVALVNDTLATDTLTSDTLATEIKKCYADDTNPYLYTATKTAYHVIHGRNMSRVEVPNCEPLQIWLLSRHGTRYPTADQIRGIMKLKNLRDKIIENHDLRKSVSLCEKDIENLRHWKPHENLTTDEAKYLTSQGEVDLYSNAQRWLKRFPNFLTKNAKYKFRSTDTQRTKASMKFFIAGLLYNSSDTKGEVVPPKNDHLLMRYKTCEAWIDKKDSPEANKELNEFFDGPELKTIVRNVNRRLGFTNINREVTFNIFLTCAFDKAWAVDKLSPWCAVFTKEEMKIFEYEDDLFRYYYSLYGNELSPSVGCAPVTDIVHRFSKLEKGDSKEPQGVFYFAHDTGIQLFYSSLGIAKDDIPLKASNYDKVQNRKWRTSLLSSFAANFAAVFYKCKSADNPHKVMLYLQEKPFHYEGCKDGLCDWEYLKKKWGLISNNCNFDVCNKTNASSDRIQRNAYSAPTENLFKYLHDID